VELIVPIFWQNNGIHRIQMNEEERKNMPPIRVNDRIGVLVNFEAQTVYFFRNGIMEGHLRTGYHKLDEGRIFPCVNLSDGSEVEIEILDLDPTQQGDSK